MSKIWPSLLEYSKQSCQDKCKMLAENQDLVLNLTRQTVLSLHLDVVFPYFAKQRQIVSSLSIDTLWSVLLTFFAKQKLALSVHLMAEILDLPEIEAFLNTVVIPENWQVLCLLDAQWNLSTAFSDRYSKIRFGYWLDCLDWQNYPFIQGNYYLLMTVFAGKSGQTKDKQVGQAAISIARKHADSQFLLDGGWSIQEKIDSPNIEVVSYSSFWQSLRTCLEEK